MAVKRINIVTSLCGAGLEREAILLRELLKPRGIETAFIHYTGGANECMETADINISLEVICPQALYLSKENWFAPNSEMYTSAYDQHLPRITKFLCKTKDCLDIWSKKVGPERCVYTSFEARDLYRPEIPRQDTFLHIAGKSIYKGTESVIAAWQLHPGALPPLTVVADNHEYREQIARNPTNITYLARVKEDELIDLVNQNRFHILPSKYEGFGHCIWEALGCGGLVITTDVPPMNQYDGTYSLAPVSSQVTQRLAKLSTVSPENIYRAVRDLGGTLYSHFEHHSNRARQGFLANNKFFRETVLGLIDAY